MFFAIQQYSRAPVHDSHTKIIRRDDFPLPPEGGLGRRRRCGEWKTHPSPSLPRGGTHRNIRNRTHQRTRCKNPTSCQKFPCFPHSSQHDTQAKPRLRRRGVVATWWLPPRERGVLRILCCSFRAFACTNTRTCGTQQHREFQFLHTTSREGVAKFWSNLPRHGECSSRGVQNCGLVCEFHRSICIDCVVRCSSGCPVPTSSRRTKANGDDDRRHKATKQAVGWLFVWVFASKRPLRMDGRSSRPCGTMRLHRDRTTGWEFVFGRLELSWWCDTMGVMNDV